MRKVWSMTQLGFTCLGGLLGWFLGGTDGFLFALIVFVVADYLSGIMCAVINRRLSSAVGAKGIFKKVLIFVLVGIGHIIDSQIIGDAGSPGGSSASVLRTAVIFFYLSNEGISLLENATVIGLPVPQKLKDMLAQLRGKGDGEQ